MNQAHWWGDVSQYLQHFYADMPGNAAKCLGYLQASTQVDGTIARWKFHAYGDDLLPLISQRGLLEGWPTLEAAQEAIDEAYLACTGDRLLFERGALPGSGG